MAMAPQINKRLLLANLCDVIGSDPRLEHLECDGMTSVLSFTLFQAGIVHKRCHGRVFYASSRLPVHYWIKVGVYFVDYRLRMWFRDSQVPPPHGVFARYRYPQLVYEVQHWMAPMDNKFIYDTLSTWFE